MVGRLLFFWDGLFSGFPGKKKEKKHLEPKNGGLKDLVPLQRGDFQVPC